MHNYHVPKDLALFHQTCKTTPKQCTSHADPQLRHNMCGEYAKIDGGLERFGYALVNVPLHLTRALTSNGNSLP